MMKFVSEIVKRLWKKEKMLVTSIFSFSHKIFKKSFSCSLIFTFPKPSSVPAFNPILGSLYYQPFPKCQILDSSKRKEFAGNNFKFDENSKTFSEQVENTVGKGAISPFYPQCFQRLQTRKIQGLFGKMFNKPSFLRGEKEKLLVTSISPFPQCFLPIWITFCHFRPI